MSRASGIGGGFVRRVGQRVRNSRPLVRGIAGVHRAGGVVLRYHSVNDDPAWSGDYVQDSLVVHPDVFDRQIEQLTTEHRVVGMDHLAGVLADGGRVPPGSVAVTFDDGYEDNYRLAFPVLEKYGATATFYVTTGAIGDAGTLWTVQLRRAVMRSRAPKLELSFVDGGPLDLSTEVARKNAVKVVTRVIKRLGRRSARDAISEIEEVLGRPEGDRRVMMNWDELRGMHDAGMSIGAHTVSHFNLPSLDTDDVVDEIATSKRVLEEGLGAPVNHFAYPNGATSSHCDARVARIVADAGFASAVTSLAGPATSRYSAYCIPRLGVVPRHAVPARFSADIEYSRLRYQDRDTFAGISEALLKGGRSDGSR